MRKIKNCIVIFAVCAVLLCSCGKKQETDKSGSVPEKAAYIAIDRNAAPVTIGETEDSFSGIQVVLPQVTGVTNSDGINKTITNGVSKLISESDGEAKGASYSVKYNRHGILSILFAVETGTGTKRYSAFNFNIAGGSEIKLNTLYKEQSSWRSVAKFYIETLLRLNKTETYASAELGENRQFCLTDEKLIVIYDTYEITYYSNGALLFEIPYSLLNEYCADGGAVDIITREG